LNARETRVGAAVTHLDFQDLELSAKTDDQVENLGQYEGVDDMTGYLYDTLRHREILPFDLDSNANDAIAQCDAMIRQCR
jgi:hypothetical protein